MAQKWRTTGGHPLAVPLGSGGREKSPTRGRETAPHPGQSTLNDDA